LDEEYLACLIEAAKKGSVEQAIANRPKVARILTHTPLLATRLTAARTEIAEGLIWIPEQPRVDNVIRKLARGHFAFEQNEPQIEEPSKIFATPLCAMSHDVRRDFEQLENVGRLCGWPEAGSRAMIRLAEGSVDGYPWIVVQPGRYRYLVATDASFVRIVIAEYLASEVQWN
jgi:hypothetical protein